MNHAREFQQVLDNLGKVLHQIRTNREPVCLVFVCEHAVHYHVARNGRLVRGPDGMRGDSHPSTENLGTCPYSDHRSIHFFTQNNGRTQAAPCRMHPLIHPVKVRGEVRSAAGAAVVLGGWEAMLPIVSKFNRFDPLVWRLWDQAIWYQRAPTEGTYAG